LAPKSTDGYDRGGDGSGGSLSSSSVAIWLIVVIVLSVILAVAVVVVVVHRLRHQEKHETVVQQQHTMAMFMNPMHPAYASSSVSEQPNEEFHEAVQDINLDSELYVLSPDADAGVYSLFRAAADFGTDQGDYSLFRAPADGHAQINDSTM
jgi:Na+-transporting NADH:ubiquinone oxidoreductase subunit NqrC